MSAPSSQGPQVAVSEDPVARWARRLGMYVWIESALFELLGRSSATLEDDRSVVLAATHSRHHGWRAELWRQHLPLLATSPPESFVAPPSRAIEDLVDALEPRSAPEGARDVMLLAGVYRVVIPSLLVTYTAHREVASPVGEPPTVRILRIVGEDTAHDLGEGENAVQRLVSSSDGAEAVASHVGRLEALIAAGGGLLGGA